MKEFGKFAEGADIRWSGKSGETKIDVVDLGNGVEHTIHEVDDKGAVTVGEKNRFNRLTVQDYNNEGVRVLKADDNPIIHPDQSMSVKVGSHVVEIFATPRYGVTVNGEPTTPATRELEIQHYPHIRRD